MKSLVTGVAVVVIAWAATLLILTNGYRHDATSVVVSVVIVVAGLGAYIEYRRRHRHT